MIGDALAAPEGKSPAKIEARFGWLDHFESGGSDDAVLGDIPCSSSAMCIAAVGLVNA